MHAQYKSPVDISSLRNSDSHRLSAWNAALNTPINYIENIALKFSAIFYLRLPEKCDVLPSAYVCLPARISQKL